MAGKNQSAFKSQRESVRETDVSGNYDAIVIGAGHNGLITACYLAKAGLKTVVIERRLEAGGGLCTEEVTLPGFLHNLHSFYHDAAAIMPPMKDLDLARYGMRYVCPPVQVGVPFADGKAITIHGDIDATCKSISRFSERDAKAYRQLHDAYREFIEIVVIPALFSPASKPSAPFAALENSPEGLDYLHLSRKSPREVVEDVFENEAVRAAILFQLTVPRGIVADYKGLGMLVPLLVSHIELSHVAVGGSHSLAHALWRALLASGGAIRGVHEVEKIIVENGAAVGVRVNSGGIVSEIRANKVVVSSIDLDQTFNRLVGAEHLEEKFIKKVDNVRLDEFSFFGVHLALKEPPKYKSSAFDANLQNALKVGIGIDGVDTILEVYEKIRNGKLPDPAGMYCSVPTLFDPTQAPKGMHTALIWQHVPFKIAGESDDVWDRIGGDYADKCIEKWSKYAPNLKDAILKRYVFTPLDIPRKLINMRNGGVFMARMSQDQIEGFRPFPELSEHRTPINNLYLAGACTHPGGGVIGGPGFNAVQIIAADLGLNKWWEV